jgi:hypothetical protein
MSCHSAHGRGTAGTISPMADSEPFSPGYRDHVSARILEWASADNRIVAAAIVGSMAHGPGDRWSDLDLSFALDDDCSLADVLQQWTSRLTFEFSACKLFDLPAGKSIYRVFLLPGCLQLDLSFTPAHDFGAIGPQFKLLFGNAVQKSHIPSPRAEDLFGYSVHHLLRARFCIERGRLLQAEYWISSARDYVLNLACLRRGLPASYGRGFDELPDDVREQVPAALVCSLDRSCLLASLSATVAILLSEGSSVSELSARVEPQLRTLTASW